MKAITRLPIGMKANSNAEFKNVNQSKTTQTVKGSNISHINTEAKTANIHTLPKGAEVKGANKEALGRKIYMYKKRLENLILPEKISND